VEPVSGRPGRMPVAHRRSRASHAPAEVSGSSLSSRFVLGRRRSRRPASTITTLALAALNSSKLNTPASRSLANSPSWLTSSPAAAISARYAAARCCPRRGSAQDGAEPVVADDASGHSRRALWASQLSGHHQQLGPIEIDTEARREDGAVSRTRQADLPIAVQAAPNDLVSASQRNA
jgi:hypothetical protein